MELFDYNVFSFDINVLKPDQKIFTSLLKITNIDPKEIVYIDSDRKNCLVAKSLGMNMIYYKDYEQLKQDLVPFGILL